MPGFQSGGYKLLALCIFLSAGLWRQHQWGTVGDKQHRPEGGKEILRAVRTVSKCFKNLSNKHFALSLCCKTSSMTGNHRLISMTGCACGTAGLYKLENCIYQVVSYLWKNLKQLFFLQCLKRKVTWFVTQIQIQRVNVNCLWEEQLYSAWGLLNLCWLLIHCWKWSLTLLCGTHSRKFNVFCNQIWQHFGFRCII